MANSMANMATQSCCQLCGGHIEEWKTAQSTLSVLRSEVNELRIRENKAIQQERCAKEQLHASLRRQQELFYILDEVKRENLALRASLQSNQIPVRAASAEPPRISQDTAEMLPQTPAQLVPFRSMSHGIPGKADLIVEISALGEVNGGLAPSSGNFETLDNRVVSQLGHSLGGLTSDVGSISPLKVVEAFVLPVIPEVEPLTEISLNPGTECDHEVEGGDIEEALRKLLEPRIQEQGDIHQLEKESQSYETEPKPLEAIDHHMDHAVSSSDEKPASLGSHRKRRKQNLVQVSSDEDEDHVASPPSKEKMFTPTERVSNSGSQFSDEMAASSGTHRKRRRNLVQASSDEDEDHVASPPSKEKMFTPTERVSNSGSQFSDEMAASSGTHRKRRRNLVQASSDEDEDHVASPPSKEKMFTPTEGVSISGSQFSDEMAASSGTHRKRRRNLVQASSDEDEDHVASPPSKEKMFTPTEGVSISGSQFSDEMAASSGTHRKRRRNLVQASSDEDEDHVASPPSKEKMFTPTEGVSISGSQFSDEMAASSGSPRKRRRRNLVQASSDKEDEDYVASPPSKKNLFKTSFDNLEASNVTPLQKNIQHRGAPESLGRVGIVGLEFGCGVTVSELVTEEPEVDGKVTPKHKLHRLRRDVSVELQGCADATEQPLEEDPEMDGNGTPKRSLTRLRKKSVELRGRADATEQPLDVGLRRSKRLSQSSPMPLNEIEDEVESSDADSGSFIVDSSAESSESSKLKTRFEGPSNVIDLSDSDSESGPPLTPRARSTFNASGTQRQGEESSESLQSSSSSDRPSFPTVVNLLKPSSDDEEEYDSDDGHDSLSDFIVHESSSSEESVSNGEEQISDSDSGEKDSGSQGTIREEIVRKRQNLIWDFEGDMLVAIQTNVEIALQAICALYRQQTEDEQSLKGVLHRNGRGFDKMNAQSGSNFAEFLLDGEPSGRLKKSARALQERFPGALNMCQDIAAHHSKQLFEIYSSNEDPYWRKPTGEVT